MIGNWNKLWHNLFPSRLFSGLLTDLYQLTMAAGYIQNQFDARATFELFVRHLPRTCNYLVAPRASNKLRPNTLSAVQPTVCPAAAIASP